MNRTLLLLTMAIAWFPITAQSAPELYGRANLSFELVDELGHTGTELESNNSRVGVRGTQDLGNGYEAVYRFEYKVDVDGDDDSTFSRRNNFLGIRSGWGQVTAGYFDTPLKVAEGSVDQFNDVRGDLGKVITAHNDRRSNMIMYTTPDRDVPVEANLAWISSESDGRSNGVSASVAYERDGIYVALAADQDVEAEGTDVARVVAVLTGSNWRVGGLIESADREVLGSADGWMLSARYTVERWAFKGQFGASDIIAEGGETVSLGADYEISDSTTAYSFVTATDNDAGQDRQYLGVGVLFNF